MRMVKCQDTGNKIEVDKAYKVTTVSATGKTTNKYWSSKAAYDAIQKQNDLNNQCYNWMFDMMSYAPGQKMNTIFFRKMKSWDYYGAEVVLMTMHEMEDKVINMLRVKEFDSEFGKMMYICAMIENNLNDVLKKKRRLDQQNTMTVKDQHVFDVDLSSVGVSNTSKDVSSLLGDTEWI